jgi:lipooligosaccharide transport system permease protein
MSTIALAARPLEFFFAQYRRVWRGTVVSSVVTPVVYLLALGVGLGSFIGDVTFGGTTYDYVEFVAPGLLAATAMQVAAFESSWPVLSAIKWSRQYHAMLATPLRVRDVLVGHQAWIALRVLMTATIYLVVIAVPPFDGVRSWWGVLAIPVAVLVGLAFSAPIAAWGARTQLDTSFVAIFRFVILPMFLFSGTFFPVSRLPLVLEVVAYATPLWHGVNLCRQLTLGQIHTASALASVAFLLSWIAVALAVAHLTYRRRLVR